MSLNRKALDHQCNNDENSFIPSSPFLMYVYGGIGSGKSSLLLNMLNDTKFYKHRFNKILILNSNYKNDLKWSSLIGKDILIPNKKLLLKIIQDKKKDILKLISQCGKNVNVKNQLLQNYDELLDQEEKIENTNYIKIEESDFTDTLDLERLNQIKIDQEYISEKYSPEYRDKYLVILDDLIHFKKKIRSEQFANFIISLRHINCCCAILSQGYRDIVKIVRTNAAVKIIFNIFSLNEMRIIFEENQPDMTFEEFQNMFNDIAQTPHSFIAINLLNGYRKKTIKNFKEFV